MAEAEMILDLIGDQIGFMQREEYRCAQLLYYLNRVEGLYKTSTGRNFRTLRQFYSDNLLHEAIKAIKAAGVIPYGDIDPTRTWREMTLADMEVVDSVLKYSAIDEFLLVRYDEPSLWSCKALEPLEDFWTAYGGLLQECRSPVVNIDTMEYAMLPFAKFRNLNESAAYALPVVQEKISKASVVEFSEKMDGSMIQMRYTGDKRFWHGIMMGTSGSLHSTRAPQLQHVLEFMERKGERIEKLVRAFPHNTFMFEWIDPRDEHMVRYGKHGLHFIGARNTNVGWQWDYHTIIRYAGEYGVPTTRLGSFIGLIPSHFLSNGN